MEDKDMPDVCLNAVSRFNEGYEIIKSGCWQWMGHKTPKGYGYISHKGRSIGAHRFSYLIKNGNLPETLVIHHVCNNPSCVNPNHLEAVKQRYNLEVSDGITAKNMKKTHCINGHELSGENIKLIFRKDGTRRKCRICDKEYKRIKRGSILAGMK